MHEPGLGSERIDWSAVAFLEPTPVVKPRVAEIQVVVAARYDLRAIDMQGDCRRRKYTWPRQIAMALSREMTSLSYPKIGELFNKDHTVVLWAYNKIRGLERNDRQFANELHEIREAICAFVGDRPALPAIEVKKKPVAYSLRWAERHKLTGASL